MFRTNSEYLRKEYAKLGFSELDEYLITEGRWDDYNPNADGWHFVGTKKRMESVILVNMVCSDWVREKAAVEERLKRNRLLLSVDADGSKKDENSTTAENKEWFTTQQWYDSLPY